MVTLRVVNKSKFESPKYIKAGDSGMDIRANIEKNIVLESLERVLIPTGIYIDIPKGYEIQIRTRSGLSLKKALVVLNSPATIDSNYTGELGVIIANLGKEKQTIEPGERIAQIVLVKVEEAEIIEVDSINKITERGDTGYGNSGRF